MEGNRKRHNATDLILGEEQMLRKRGVLSMSALKINGRHYMAVGRLKNGRIDAQQTVCLVPVKTK